MTEQKTEGLKHIRRALLSVSDKTGLVEFARALRGVGVDPLSTGGTAKALRDAGLEVRDVADVTGFPEMLDGRVKTLHPRIHGGILAVRERPEHARALEEHRIEPIDMVVINLYPFEQTIAREGVTLEEAVEQIDIGGPAMVRSAAKNFKDVAVVVSPEFYERLTEEMSRNKGALSLFTREELALSAFRRTATYDLSIYAYLQGRQVDDLIGTGGFHSVAGTGITEPHSFEKPLSATDSLPNFMSVTMRRAAELRYGENPHQRAALYDTSESAGIAQAEVLGGKEMSFNNYVDADAAC